MPIDGRKRARSTLCPVALGLVLAGAAIPAAGQDRELRGFVYAAGTEEPVAGAWVGLEEEYWGTFSRNDGHFYLPEAPRGARRYSVSAIGYRSRVVSLDPSETGHVVELVPDQEVLEGLELLMDQLQARRNRSGDMRYFDREMLAFSGAFDLAALMERHGIAPVRRVCLDERPEPAGSVLEREPHEFYMIERFGPMLRVYTEEFVEAAAKDRRRVERLPGVC